MILYCSSSKHDFLRNVSCWASTNKTDRHNTTEILLKLALNIITLKPLIKTLKCATVCPQITNLRIAAYIQVMKCPNEYIISQVRDTLASEEVNQVNLTYFQSFFINRIIKLFLYKQKIIHMLKNLEILFLLSII
jgi:hypothetical protein